MILCRLALPEDFVQAHTHKTLSTMPLPGLA